MNDMPSLSAQEKMIILEWRIRELDQRLATLRHEKTTTRVDADHEESYRLYYEKEIRNNTARKNALINLIDSLSTEANDLQ